MAMAPAWRTHASRFAVLLTASLFLASCSGVATAVPAESLVASPPSATPAATTAPAPTAAPSPTPVPTSTADPMAIVVGSMRSLSALRSVHMSMVMSGSARGDLLQLGSRTGVLEVDGVTAETDVDMRGPAVRMHLEAPSLMGISADVISIGNDTWVRTSIGGVLWSKTSVAGSPSPTAVMQIEPLLRNGSVKAQYLGAESCGTEVCDRVQLSTTMVASASQFVDATVWVRRSDGLPTAVVIEMRQTLPNNQPQLYFSIKVDLSGFDEPVSIVAPDPADVSTRQPFGIPAPVINPSPSPVVMPLDCNAIEKVVLKVSPVTLARDMGPQVQSVPKGSCVFVQDPMPKPPARVAVVTVSFGTATMVESLMSFPDAERIEGVGDFASYAGGQMVARKGDVTIVVLALSFPSADDPKPLVMDVMRTALAGR
jgi:hypothetical protein